MNECKPLHAGGAAADEPPLDMLQQGAAGLHGLQNHGLTRAELKRRGQGLTLGHFSAQLEPCLPQENTLNTA